MRLTASLLTAALVSLSAPATAHPSWPVYKRRALNRTEDTRADLVWPPRTGLIHALNQRLWVINHARQRWMKLERKHQARIAAQQAAEEAEAVEPTVTGSASAIVCSFDWDCDTAMDVMLCESDGDVNAENGQYLGAWQMGEDEREAYGHGYDLYTQTAAAYRYYSVSGWGPWSCY